MERKSLVKDRMVFITGASSGIGKACAEQFAHLGANLIITARRSDRLNATATELSSKYGIKCLPFQLDVRDNEQVESVFKNLEKEHIEVDILVNNAGLALSSDKLQEGKVSNWDTMIDTNLKGLLYVTKAALPSMLKKNCGHIINIGSVTGHGCYLPEMFIVQQITHNLKHLLLIYTDKKTLQKMCLRSLSKFYSPCIAVP